MRQLKIATQITNRDSQAVEKYLQEISKISMIAPEEETTLAQRIHMGDQVALEKLVKANLRFVVSVAKQYQHQGLSLSDLINEGNLGLIKAAQRFDETKGFKFISYAVWWIRQSILQALAEQGRLVRLPQNKIGTYNKANKAYIAFEQANEREPSTEELASILEMSETEVTNIFTTNTRHTSLDAPVHEAEDVAMGDLLAGGDVTDDDVMKDSLRSEIHRILKSLSVREAEILSAYFGLEGDNGPTIEEIGQKYDLTKERIRQIKERAIKRLQKARYSNSLKGYLG
ncbi:MAG: RNA polymerase sigma factor RpoD/SigA [Chitinophagaceae bacterium]|nr:RNA polymerase sigma factor RpoD/SigA [Chitinophagaceae bacterium]MCB9046312.1 RNA polymerase sigma factor RpoD/SigA [Chitinophagales bacterium]